MFSLTISYKLDADRGVVLLITGMEKLKEEPENPSPVLAFYRYFSSRNAVFPKMAITRYQTQ